MSKVGHEAVGNVDGGRRQPAQRRSERNARFGQPIPRDQCGRLTHRLLDIAKLDQRQGQGRVADRA